MNNKTYQVLENDEPLDIRYDNVFKAVFTKETPESRTALSKLVSALISRNVTIETIWANEPAIENLRDRQLRFDINCRTDDDELVNVEMSLYPNAHLSVRLEFHTAKLFVGQDIRGTDKSYNDLNRTYQISILANERFFNDDIFFHTFEYYDKANDRSLDGKTQIITLEFSKLNKIVEKPTNEMSVSERWAVYFQYLTDTNKRGKINEILETEEGIAMTSQVLMTISRDEEERARMLLIEKNELDIQSFRVDLKRAQEEAKAEVLKAKAESAKVKEEAKAEAAKAVEEANKKWEKIVADNKEEIARLRKQLEGKGN
jgi:predicted transposase/invertase (TIGR01784 family)